ncbi:MAG: DNA adenine methylase [Armatimonadota bacterium]
MIKYIGSKRLLAPRIVAAFQALPGVRSVADPFSGTARVGHSLKRAGFEVHASDYLRFASTLARCYIAADAAVWAEQARSLIADLQQVPPEPGYFTETFCQRSRYFRPENGAKVDAIRERIARLQLHPELEAIALVSLMEAADRVDSTTGLQMAYLKDWAPRARNPLELRLPALLPGVGYAREGLAEEIAPQLDVNAAYLDPPYNQHSYLGNYHIWETLCRWDKPAFYGTACKRLDVRTRRSRFNSKRQIRAALQQVLDGLRCPWIVASFSDEGYLARDELIALLAPRGHVEVVPLDYKRYVGAQIGIHNHLGQRVGEVSHLRNTEYLFIAGPDGAAVERATRAAGQPNGTDGLQVALPIS